jgi:O-antigen ligase
MTSLLDKGSFVAVCLVLVLLPLVSHAGGLGVAPLVFILGLLGIALSLKSRRFQITRVQIALIIFLAWLCVTALWSPYKPDDLLTNYLKLLLMGVVFYWSRPVFEHASAKRPRRSRHLFMAAIFFTVGLLVIDLLSNFGLTLLFNPATDFNDKIFKLIDAEMNLGHSITISVLLASPVIMLMLTQLPNPYARPLALFFIVLLALAAWLNGLTAGLLGLMGVILATIAGYAFPQRVPQLLLNVVIFAIMASPLLSFVAFSLAGDTGTDLPQSWDHRIRMWGYCWDVIMQHPIAGAGFDASRTFDETFIARDGREITIVSLHPHNAGIQIWTEAGLIGAVLASIVIGTLSKPVKEYVQSRAHGGSVSGVIMASLVISSLTYGAWQFWWWACLFLAVGALRLLPDFKSSELKTES